MTTTTAALNRRLARAVGLNVLECACGCGSFDCTDSKGRDIYFIPAASTDHLRLYVLPEIVKRGLFFEFIRTALDAVPPETSEVADKAVPVRDGILWPTRIAKMILADPAVLAEAACVVLEGSNA